MKLIVLLFVLYSSVLFAQVNIDECKKCHGEKFEKIAYGVSEIVKNMSKLEIEKALLAYKSGKRDKYGMGLIMKLRTRFYKVNKLKEIAKKIGR